MRVMGSEAGIWRRPVQHARGVRGGFTAPVAVYASGMISVSKAKCENQVASPEAGDRP